MRAGLREAREAQGQPMEPHSAVVQTPQSYNTRTRWFALSHTEDQTYGFICFLFPTAT